MHVCNTRKGSASFHKRKRQGIAPYKTIVGDLYQTERKEVKSATSKVILFISYYQQYYSYHLYTGRAAERNFGPLVKSS